MDPISRYQQHPRSNSIGGQEFHSPSGYQRLKHSLYAHQSPVVNTQQYYNPDIAHNHINLIQQQQQQRRHSSRANSPLSVVHQSPLLSVDLQQQERLHQRNPLHASLDCLDMAYPEYIPNSQSSQHSRTQQSFNLKQQQLSHQHHMQQQQQQQCLVNNSHYAANYVLMPAPADVVISQNGEQDLAAAAMSHPSQQLSEPNKSMSQMTNINNQHNYQHQNFIKRPMPQICQSPLRRISGLNNYTPGSGGQQSSLLNHIANLNNSMRAGHSSLSLTSSSYLIEEKLQNEIKMLRSELKTEKEKNEALNSQLNINSNLMSAFEQSLTTLNTRLRQLTTSNEEKDKEINYLKGKFKQTVECEGQEEKRSSSNGCEQEYSCNDETSDANHHYQKSIVNVAEVDTTSERDLIKTIEDLKRQLIEKDRLLTDTRLEALSAAHQLEQLESRLNGEHNILTNDEDLDEGVMVVNHSPSDSDAITDSAHFSEINSQISKSNERQNDDMISFTPTKSANARSSDSGSYSNARNSNNSNYECEQQPQNRDNQSTHSSDYNNEDHQPELLNSSVSQQFDAQHSACSAEMINSFFVAN